MYQSWAVVARFQTVNRSFVEVTRLGQALNGTPGRLLLDGLLQTDKFFSIREKFPTVDRYVELFPQLLLVQHFTIKRGNVQLGKLGGAITIGGKVPGVNVD